ncbi:MAG: hypothetical protein Q7J34_09865 [Bacteroidales bacterium]|nr:hypothetical protein [Bacteroidales bacterium]
MKTAFRNLILIALLGTLASCNQSASHDTKQETAKGPVLVYDNNKNIIERIDITYNPDSTIRGRSEYYYKYDNNNNRIEEIYISKSANGTTLEKTINNFKYINNLKVESIYVIYDANGVETLWLKNVFKYNKAGNEIEETQYNKAGFKTNTALKLWNSEGQLFEEKYIKYTPEGKPLDTSGIKYSERGAVIKTY